MIGDREPHMTRRGGGPLRTMLDCELGNHTGHFTISRVAFGDRQAWGCDACISTHIREAGEIRGQGASVHSLAGRAA